MRARLLPILATVAAVALCVSSPAPGVAQSLSDRIDEAQGRVDDKRAQEEVLTAEVRGYTDRINTLQADITTLQADEARIQADLDAKLARLAEIQDELRTERARLVRLRARLAEGRRLLAERLVDLYKSDSPDILTVVLNSDGFAAMLENSEFARRVSRQDQRIITQVTTAKAESERTEERLDDLEAEASETAAAVEEERDEVAGVRVDLESRRDNYADARADKNAVLSNVKADREEFEGDLAALQEKEAEIQAKLAGVDTSTIGPPRQGGSLVWPVNGPIVSGFGMRWGRLHAGVDIAIASGTPVVASLPGTVSIAGPVSGYGNYVCITHTGGLSTCYAHNTSLAVSVGQTVSQGQVIASSGCTGHCFGPHVHFETRVNGVPVDPMGYL